MATKTPNTGEPSPLQKRCNTETDRILTRIAELLAAKEPSLTVQRILDGNVRLAFGEGVNAAVFLLHSGYGITHVQDMLIGVFQDVHDRIASTDVHAVAVRSTSTDLALNAGAVAVVDASSLPTPASTPDRPEPWCDVHNEALFQCGCGLRHDRDERQSER